MATLYKFKAYFTKQGIGTAPSSAPVATVVNTDTNIKLADTQATTALSNLAGYYEYEYSGADALDLVCLFHTSDTTVDQQDLVSYVVDKVYQPDQYKADISGLALEATLTAIKGTGWTDENLVSIQAAIEAIDTDSIMETLIDGFTFEQIIQIMAATLAGKLTKTGNTLHFRDLADTVDRLIVETDNNKQRIGTTYTV